MRRSLSYVARLSPEYHMERDYLTACILRISGGFCPSENLRKAQEHLNNIQRLINEVKVAPKLESADAQNPGRKNVSSLF
tara:strand:- start:193 stop:432 length:240 start_codon:yes stop_codon:yes gene_type:complete